MKTRLLTLALSPEKSCPIAVTVSSPDPVSFTRPVVSVTVMTVGVTLRIVLETLLPPLAKLANVTRIPGAKPSERKLPEARVKVPAVATTSISTAAEAGRARVKVVPVHEAYGQRWKTPALVLTRSQPEMPRSESVV